MSLTALPSGLEWFAAIAEMTAGVCLAIPALRLSRHLLQFVKRARFIESFYVS